MHAYMSLLRNLTYPSDQCLVVHDPRDSKGEGCCPCVRLPLDVLDQGQRDLYIAMRDLFIRHDRLSIDQVERLRKRVESTSMKLESVKATQKEHWEEEAERLVELIEKDQATIAAQLHRRIFIR